MITCFIFTTLKALIQSKLHEKMEDAEKEGTQVQRRMTIVAEIGMEGKYVQPGQFEGKSIAVFTSGGDAQGMNSAVRAVVRMGIYCGCKVYFIKEGYQGMVDGGECIVEATWAEVSGIMQLGGTVIGSARCSQFREREGRLKAAKNLLLKDITNLVVIGGDGSLTGANLFREEWTDLLWELADRGDITSTVRDTHNQLNIVGLVGSIDNDFCGTDMTIGTDSALHRIIEATDAIVTTAQSHQRCFVLEVMGRHCGYLALVGALASEADYLFMPEHPPEAGWEDKLCSKLNKNRSLGQRVNILIVAEGAIDRNGEPITSEQIRKLITDKLNIDTRITVLGHVQRGGSPSAFDRILGIRMGAEAVLALMDADKKKDTPACVISIDGNQTVRVPLMGCVRKTRDVSQAMANKDFEKAAALRGRSFNNNLKVYLMLSKICAPETADTESHVIGVVSVGAPAGGMNACMRSFVRLGITRNYRIKSIPEGFRGIQGEIKDFHWNDVRGWAGLGGCAIGVRRVIPSQVGLDLVAEKFRELKLRGLLIIGGFEAYISLLELYEARDKYPEFRIPMIVVPATISNNVPGTEFTLGCDTSINEITQIIDKIKQSANGSMRRVFVVETMGAYCGYLATMSGLAGGADAAYIFEEPFNVTDLKKDAEHMRQKILDHVTRGLILCADYANSNYNTDFIHRLFKEESRNVFDCRMNVLGHSQQGGFPSPFDRNMGTKLGAKAIEWLDNAIRQHTNDLGAAVETTADDTAVLLGMVKAASVFTPVINLKSETDFKHRMPNKQWWMKLRSLMRIMAKHDALYEPEMARIVSKYNKT